MRHGKWAGSFFGCGIVVSAAAAFAISAENQYVVVTCDTQGVEAIVPVDVDFYITTRSVGSPPFEADVSVAAKYPWRRLLPPGGRTELEIGEWDIYKVEDETGLEDDVEGRIYVLKLDIEQSETNVCWKSSSVTLNLTQDSAPGGEAVWSSEPAGISGTGSSVTFDPNELAPGAYVVTAQSSVLPDFFDTCVVNVIHVELTPDTLSDCPRCLGVPVFSLTNSFAPNGVSWVISPQGTGCTKKSEDPAHVEIDVGSIGDHYTITAISKDCPDANDISDLFVYVPSDIEQTDMGYVNELLEVGNVDVVTVTRRMIHSFSPSLEGASAAEHFCFIQKFRGTVLKDGAFATMKLYGTNIVTLNSWTWMFDSTDTDPAYNSEESPYGHSALADIA